MSRRVISALAPELALALEHDLLRRDDVHLVTARSIAELVSLARDGAELCLVEPLLPDGDALDALDAIRDTPSPIPVVLVTPRDAPRLAGVDEGFAAIIQVPEQPVGAVEELLGRLLGAPRRRGERRPASARVHDATGAPLGRVVNVARAGLALRTRRDLAIGDVVALTIELDGAVHPARARVVRKWEERVALELDAPSPELTLVLEGRLAPQATRGGLSFRPTPQLGPGAATVGGRLVEGPALAALVEAMASRGGAVARLSVRELAPIDEAGVDLWIALLARLAEHGPIELHACPAWLVGLAGRLPALLGPRARRAVLGSIELALRCASCGDEPEEEVRWPAGDRALATAAIDAARARPCIVCGGALALATPLAVTTAFLDT